MVHQGMHFFIFSVISVNVHAMSFVECIGMDRDSFVLGNVSTYPWLLVFVMVGPCSLTASTASTASTVALKEDHDLFS